MPNPPRRCAAPACWGERTGTAARACVGAALRGWGRWLAGTVEGAGLAVVLTVLAVPEVPCCDDPGRAGGRGGVYIRRGAVEGAGWLGFWPKAKPDRGSACSRASATAAESGVWVAVDCSVGAAAGFGAVAGPFVGAEGVFAPKAKPWRCADALGAAVVASGVRVASRTAALAAPGSQRSLSVEVCSDVGCASASSSTTAACGSGSSDDSMRRHCVTTQIHFSSSHSA